MADNFNEHVTDQNRPPIQEATVTPLVVTMRVTDRNGNDIRAAEVGDLLSLRFEIPDETSPYEIFVREIIADDGIDNAEYMLVDRQGCPTDVSIMGPVIRSKSDGKSMEAQFEAFKFPTSGIVQFRALVVPCLPTCEPVQCTSETHDGFKKQIASFGRRKRDIDSVKNETNEEMVVMQSIEITDKFPFFDNQKSSTLLESNEDEQNCLNVNSLVVLFVMFLFLQVIVACFWTCLRLKKRNTKEKLHGVFDISAIIPMANRDDSLQSIYSGRDTL
ncbi:hypothetical protein B4U79_11087 [Dinothrombium tinctorium]|uniref:ZP domain-containing protein n=1 Tax=Dinothrombium tinctorium TaxID=1965070 RepID=A0A443R6S8_9ACAR|nr:hypothetical protein B4U79_11087 [Dinothrombium tinctorium]